MNKKIQKFKFCNFNKALHMTHLLELLGKMYKYEMCPESTVEDTEQTQFHADEWADGEGETSIPFQLCWCGRYEK